MKKRLIAFLLLMLVLHMRVLATDGFDVSTQVKIAFKADYPLARFATWQRLQGKQIYAVRFVNANTSALAYYNEEGEHIAITKSMQLSMLPEKLRTKIGGLYNEMEIKEVQELILYNKKTYFFTIESNGRKHVVEISPAGQVRNRKKIQQ